MNSCPCSIFLRGNNSVAKSRVNLQKVFIKEGTQPGFQQVRLTRHFSGIPQSKLDQCRLWPDSASVRVLDPLSPFCLMVIIPNETSRDYRWAIDELQWLLTGIVAIFMHKRSKHWGPHTQVIHVDLDQVINSIALTSNMKLWSQAICWCYQQLFQPKVFSKYCSHFVLVSHKGGFGLVFLTDLHKKFPFPS